MEQCKDETAGTRARTGRSAGLIGDPHFDGERYGRDKIDEQRHPEQQHSGAKRPGQA